MRKRNTSHKKRIEELIVNGFSNQQIQSMIYREYNIQFALGYIENKKDLLNNVKNGQQQNNNLELQQRIINVIHKNKNRPIAINKIHRELDKIYSRNQIIRQIKNMSELIDYNKFTERYRLINHDDKNQELAGLSHLEIRKLFGSEKIDELIDNDILSNLKKEISKYLVQINSGNKKFDDIVRSIVRDNNITPTEEEFLKHKAKELNISNDFLEKAKNALHKNNPYFDNLIHLVFEDGKITNDEIAFLSEKITENEFSIDYFNIRFWQIAITAYSDILMSFENFKLIVNLWGLNHSMNEKNKPLRDEDFYTSLCINNGSSFEEIIENGQSFLFELFISGIKKDLEINKLERFLRSINLNSENTISEINEKPKDNLLYLKQIIQEEKRRIGDPSADLLAENILFRIQNKL